MQNSKHALCIPLHEWEVIWDLTDFWNFRFLLSLQPNQKRMNNISRNNMYIKMYGRFCRHLYECWIF